MRCFTAYIILCWIIMSTTIFSLEINPNTTHQVAVRCKEPIVLQCNITTPNPGTIIKMEWENICNNSVSNERCSYVANKSLTYTIAQAKPTDASVYTCRVETSTYHGKSRSNVTVQDCKGVKYIIQDKMQCSFGFYPKGEVHWFYNNTRAPSDWSKDKIVNVSGGLFNISSTLNTTNISDSLKHQYNCSLWIPQKKYYLDTQAISPNNSLNKTNVSWSVLFLCLILGQKLCF